ncbi:MAG TPA: thioredoxin TrxC [Steroidobacter sp.]|jgi:thioredoxin 2|nr:thioredoxin TrxC [Steroidobacteraceae bacterium]HLS82098.1 thioredoxin TrxC [Steroidobacter sp.]
MSVHIVCSNCDSVVRVPHERLTENPLCPRCRAQLIDGKPHALTSSNFDRCLRRNDLPLVVDVWAPWCGPCRMMEPHFNTAAKRFAQRARFTKLNSDEESALASRFKIRGVPTLLVFRNGQEIARQTGALDSDALTRWLTSVLG